MNSECYELSAILNSRPLCPISKDPNNLEVLELQFVYRARRNLIQGCSSQSVATIGPDAAKFLEEMEQRVFVLVAREEQGEIWTSQHKKDENLPPLKWHMGRVEEVISGQDGIIRVAMVRAAAGLAKRAVAKLAVLPFKTELVESGSLPTLGGCSQQNQS